MSVLFGFNILIIASIYSCADDSPKVSCADENVGADGKDDEPGGRYANELALVDRDMKAASHSQRLIDTGSDSSTSKNTQIQTVKQEGGRKSDGYAIASNNNKVNNSDLMKHSNGKSLIENRKFHDNSMRFYVNDYKIPSNGLNVQNLF